ncbi:related to 5',5'''-P-1,P-4-tetraphosphate phosphorylase 2 [Phialocephala subalpina]|uniref:Related to 5',5'''-P-1,P-4-tetraphosphate phosphorylase 2 n=1 Tax=Phialocephala subalpina TaxID=576137 RepID=A0A1L7XME0_9HELO|nr:related to 5',5'''-P-1,P-4-tetraphosphate phosphorylase 2 [Phialocephala subalpina]
MATIRGLPSLVRKQFKAAQEFGDLTFYATQVAILQCNGLPFQLRFSPALAKKPKSNKSADSKPVDPFENPPPGFFITDIAPAHYLVLNKFPVNPAHFILATKEFKKQTDLLEENDLAAAYECLRSYKEEGEELFGFFNSGEHSGASQPHRHIQFLPVQSMLSGIDPASKWEVLADSLTKSPQIDLPFKYFASALPINPTSKQIHELYLELYGKACQVSGKAENNTSEESSISYNLGLTDRAIVVCPRVSEGTKIQDTHGKLLGPIALNGTILGGTLLVKTEDEWNALQDDELRLMEILNAVGISSKNLEGRL